MRLMIAALLLLGTSPLAAQIATPERPVTDPKALESPVNPEARAVPLEDIGNSRSVGSTTWSATASCRPPCSSRWRTSGPRTPRWAPCWIRSARPAFGPRSA